MSFLGMGPLEILLILMVGFIVMGPDRMFDAARLLGKATREARKMAEDLPRLGLEDEQVDAPEGHKGPSDEGPGPRVSPAGADADSASTDEADGRGTKEDGPVAFQSTGPADPPRESEGPQQQDKA